VHPCLKGPRFQTIFIWRLKIEMICGKGSAELMGICKGFAVLDTPRAAGLEGQPS
jgi:hypothetical protein